MTGTDSAAIAPGSAPGAVASLVWTGEIEVTPAGSAPTVEEGDE